MATTTTSALSMKLLIDTNARRVLFAEASKDVVDLFFSLLALPVGTAVKLLGKEAMVGCVGSLYGSVEKLDATYVQPDAAKDALLHPAVLSPAVSTNMFRLTTEPSTGKSKGFYKCRHGCTSYVTDTSGTQCPSCGSVGAMTTVMHFTPGKVAASVGGKGFVQGIVTYTVMDDLTVTPMSSISSITLLNSFAVKDLSALQEKTVQLGYDQGLEILKASLQSKTVLTDVFLEPASKA